MFNSVAVHFIRTIKIVLTYIILYFLYTNMHNEVAWHGCGWRRSIVNKIT